MKKEINAVIRALGGDPKAVRIVTSGLPQDKIVARLANEHHAHAFRETVAVKDIEVSVFDVPTLFRKFVVYTGSNGDTFTGYIDDAVYTTNPAPKATKDDENERRLRALIAELAFSPGSDVTCDIGDFDEHDWAVVARHAAARGIRMPKAAKAKSREAVRAAESRKSAKVLGGKALKGTARQKAWAEEIRKVALQRCTSEQAESYLTDPAYAHAAWWIENRERFGFQVSREARIANEIYGSYSR